MIYLYPVYDFISMGVVVFDVDSIKREPGLVESLIAPMRLNDDTERIIEIMKGRIFILPPCWNAICGIYHLYPQVHEKMVLDRTQYVHEDAKIVHHLGIEKPWHDYSLDELRADPQKVREHMYAELNLGPHGHSLGAVFQALKDQECVEEYCDLTKAWRDSHDRYMGMLKH